MEPTRQAPGVYVLRLGAEVVYVGESTNVGRRIREHRFEWDNSQMVFVPAHHARRVAESVLISHFNPERNLHKGYPPSAALVTFAFPEGPPR